MSSYDPSDRHLIGPRALLILLVLIGAGSGILGAAYADEKERAKDQGGGGSLSDAARETAKRPEEQKVLHADGGGGSASPVFVGLEASGGSCLTPQPYGGVPPATTDYPAEAIVLPAFHFGVVAEAGTLGSPDFGRTTLYGLRIGINDRRRTSFDVILLHGSPHFRAGSDLAARFQGPTEVAADISLRCSITSPSAPCGIAPVVGFRAGWLSWHYQNGIWFEKDGYVGQEFDDGLKHYSPYLGLAVTVLRSRHVELGVTGIAGWRYYSDHTDIGLQNDLFGGDHFSELRLETRISQ